MSPALPRFKNSPGKWISLWLLLNLTTISWSQPIYSYTDLIGSLTNLERLAVLPSVGEKSAEWTSTDHASTYNTNTGQYVNWNANNDDSGNLGTQGDGGIILAQMTGPGCISRIWSGQAGSGHVKIFLDGSSTPAVDLAFQDYFNGTQFPFNFTALNYSVFAGFDSYLPIPYHQSCKVVAYGNWGRYFHFTYTTFAPGTIVPSFTTNLTAGEKLALTNANQFLANQLGADPAGIRSGQITVTNSFSIAPGQFTTNLNLGTQAAITSFKVRLKDVSGISIPWRALRELTVSMYWDGETNPSVWAPLGDFFGSSCGYIPYQSLPMGMQSNGWMYCHWYMPFASGAKITLGNDGNTTRHLDVEVTYAPLTKPINSLARFHAKWNRGTYVTTNGRAPDYRFLAANGAGRFVGLAMHVYQKLDVSPGPWWGEGDEKFFVDGEAMPSWFGTGSEDYFGFAWGTPGYFSRAFHSQLLAPPGDLYAPGNRALNRVHITDNVPFQNAFDACIEKWNYPDESNTRYSLTPFWYLAAGSSDTYSPQPLNVRTNYYTPDFSFAWQNGNGGLWNVASNWDNLNIADGAGMGADFSGLDLTNTVTVQLDSSRKLGSLIFGDATFATPASWIVSDVGNSANTLTITGLTSSISVNALGAGAGVTINAGIRSASNLTKSGDGTLTFGSSNTLAGIIINGGTNIINGHTSIAGNGPSFFYLGNANTAYRGTMILQTRAVLSVSGNFSDSAVIGRDGGDGTFIQNGGTFNYNPANVNYLFVGAANNPATQARYDMNGGLLDLNNHILGLGLGNGATITSVMNHLGGVITNVGTLNVGALTGNGIGIYNLTGGRIHISAGGITTSSGSYQVNLGGGVLSALVNWNSTLNLTLTGSNGPVTFDTTGKNILLSGVLTGSGGLIKAGPGILELAGANTYSGETLVNAGSLKIDSANSRYGTVKLTSGAQLNLNFSGAILVTNLFTNNVALPKGSYTSTNLPNFITGTGTVQVVNNDAPLAYEGFAYAPSSIISGANGGYGWSNSWVDVSGNSGESVMTGNLVAGSSAPAGFDLRSAANSLLVSNGSRCGRWLDCSPSGVFARAGLLETNGNIGADGKTIYVSFVQQPSGAGYFYEFEFHRNNLGDAGRIAGIGNDVGNSTQVNLRAPGNSQTPLGVGTTSVNFYVVRLDFKNGNDDVYVYRNPKGSLESNNEPVLSMLSVADMSFDGLAMGAFLNGVTLKIDEIRVGLTWASALGDPPQFVLQPTSQTVGAEQSITLESLAQSTMALSYQWYRLTPGGTNALFGKTNSSLSFPTALPSDAGQYFVIASNTLGLAVSAIATLVIPPIAVAITGPTSVPIESGDGLVIHATVNGAQPLTMQWFKNGQAISSATTSIFSLDTVNPFSAGQYFSVASNSYGSITSSIVNVFLNTGGPFAYEGFDYATSSSDNSGFGWSGNWANLSGAAQTLSNNLLAGANAPAGFDSHSISGNVFVTNNSRRGRFLDCSATGNFAQRGYLNASGDIGADGKTLYLSFLQQPNGTGLFYELEWHRGVLGDAGRMGGIGNDTANSTVNLRTEVPPGGISTFRSLGAGNTNVNFYVVRIDFKSGNDDVFIYRNPTSATEPAMPTLTVSNIADMSFDGISLAAFVNSRTVSHDEIRLGMTWSDVIGNTIPAQLLLAQRTNNISRLLLAGAPNYNYFLQATTNLLGPWANIGSVFISALGTGQADETNASAQRFYRTTNSPTWSAPPSTDLIFANFEQPTYGAWLTTGNAFGSGPAQGTLPNQNSVSGYAGSGLVNSYFGSDTATGTLTSPPFIVSQPFIGFLIGGGNLPGLTCMNLLISNVVVKTATGANAETLMPQQWDVSAYLGQTAVIQIVDNATGGWGHINVDQIVFTETALPSLTRAVMFTNQLLNLPVQNSAPMRRVTVTVGGQPVRDFNIRLATGAAPDWWAFVDVAAFSNQPAILSVSSLSSVNDGFYSIIQTNGLVDGTNLYRETLRPQLHFSTKRGWLNDANGMVFHNGNYHLYYQHDPFDWGGGGQKWWGHAISQDMVNWTEIQEGLYVHTYGDQVYSGSAIVDTADTGGFKTGTNQVIVAAFTSTARGECIDYSNDGGVTFTEITNNPVIVHNGRDPHLLWYAPSNYWVMAVYDETGAGGISFYSSPNFRQWTFRSKLNGYFECPDIFQLPVDGNTNNLLWLLCDASSGYQLGQFNGATFTPSTAKLPGNNGSAFYASQTFTSMAPGDKRLVRIGWAIIDTPGMPFNQLMYFPTELNLRTTTNGVRLCSTPIPEIANNTVTSYVWTNVALISGSNPLSGIRGSLFDLKTQFSVGTAQSIIFSFQGLTVTYSVASQQISCNGVNNVLAPINGSVQLEIIVDRNTVEIFGNNGQLYMPLPASNPLSSNLISLTCTGGSATIYSLKVDKLKSVWPVL